MVTIDLVISGINKALQQMLLAFGMGLFVLELGAQPDINRIHTLDQPVTDVSDLIQDEAGFIWIATYEGVIKYDGYTLMPFHPVNEPDLHLRIQGIEEIVRSSSGHLWIAHQRGVSCIDLSTSKYVLFQGVDGSSTYSLLQNEWAYRLTEDQGGDIWVGTLEEGLTKISWSHNLEDRPLLSTYFENSTIESLKTSEDALWVSIKDLGVYRMASDDVFRHIWPIRKESADVKIRYSDIEVDQKTKSVWLTSWEDGLSRLQMDTKFSEVLQFHNWKAQDSQPSAFYKAVRTSDGIIWIASYGLGLYNFDPTTEIFQNFQYNRDSKNSIPNDIIISLFKDRQENIWLGTFGNDIAVVHPGRNQFMRPTLLDDEADMKSQKSVVSIVETHNQTIWLATSRRGVYRSTYLPKSGVREEFEKVRELSGLGPVDFLFKDSRDNLWINISVKGWYKYDTREGLLSKITWIENQSVDRIADAIETPDGNFWMATRTNGLLKINNQEKTTKRYRNIEGDSSSLNSNAVYCLFSDSSGRLWVGTNNGIAVKNIGVDSFVRLQHDPDNDHSLSHNEVNQIVESDGVIWVATMRGLNKISYGSPLGADRFLIYDQTDGLADDNIKSIIAADNGQIWMGTKYGISCLQKQTERFYNFDLTNNLQSYSFNPRSILKDREGFIYFGSILGLNIIHPDSITFSETNFPVRLTQFRLLNQTVSHGEVIAGRVLLADDISQTERIELASDENSISFRFSTLNYKSNHIDHFQYKLEGFDKQWIKTNSNEASYTNLDPGTYRFLVKKESQTSNNGAEVEVIILPHFLQSTEARIIYILALIGILYLIHRIIKSNNELKIAKIEKAKEHELTQTKLRFFTNISHEIRTPLTLIKGYLDELVVAKATDVRWGSPLNAIYQNTQKLLMLINQLLDFRKIENDSLGVSVSKVDVNEQIDEVINFFRYSAERQSKKIEFHSDFSGQYCWYDEDKLEKILFNLISNALKFSDSGGTVRVTLLVTDNKGHLGNKEIKKVMILEVKDTGRGIDKANLEGIFRRFYQVNSEGEEHFQGSGIGLAFTQRLVEIQQGMISVESELGQGTTFRVVLPASKDHIADYIPDENMELTEGNQHRELNGWPDLLETEVHENDPGDVELVFTVLIVEDNAEVLTLLKRVFNTDYRVFMAKNGQEGLELARELQPDIVISDVVMPIMDGYELCRQLKSNYITSHIPIILLSAKTSDEHQVEGYEFGADAYMTKPFNGEVLKSHIKSIITSRKILRDRFAMEPHVEPKDITVNSEDERFLQQAIDLVENNLKNESFTTEMLADQLNLSRTVLFRKMKNLTGCSANAFIKKIRMKQAAYLIEKNFGNLTQICYEVGLNDVKHFRNSFKEHFGVTPSDYKAGIKPSELNRK